MGNGDAWRLGYSQYLAQDQAIIVAMHDNVFGANFIPFASARRVVFARIRLR